MMGGVTRVAPSTVARSDTTHQLLYFFIPLYIISHLVISLLLFLSWFLLRKMSAANALLTNLVGLDEALLYSILK